MVQFETGRIRRLIADERKYLWNPLSNVTIAVRIKGTVEEDRLINAINKAKERHPLLSSRVVYDQDGSAWFHNDNVPGLVLRTVTRDSENRWLKELGYENRMPFNLFSGPLVRFILVKSPEASEFMVYCQHSICDGRGLLYLIRDILTYTAEPDMEVKPLPLPPMLAPEDLVSYVPSRASLKDCMRKFIIRRMNEKWRKDPVIFDQEDYENVHQAYWKSHEYRLEFMELSEDRTRNLLAQCRQQGVTINSALSTAYLAARSFVLGPFKGRQRTVALPVDLRNHMKSPVADVLCFYISRVIFGFDYNSRKDFWTNVKRFHNTARKEITSANIFEPFVFIGGVEPAMIDAMAGFGTLAETVPSGFSRYEKLSDFARKTSNPAIKLARRFLRLSPGLVLTNLGNIDFPVVYGNMQVEKVFFAPSTDKRFPLVLGAVTAAGRLVLSINYVDKTQSEEMIKIRDRALKILQC